MPMEVKDPMALSTKGTRGCFATQWRCPPLLLILMLMTLDVDAFTTNQPTIVKCVNHDKINVYCNITYQYCDQDNPQCLLCSKICHNPHACSEHCPIYYKNAIEASAKLPKSTTPLYDSTTEQTDLGPTSPESTVLSNMATGWEETTEIGVDKPIPKVRGAGSDFRLRSRGSRNDIIVEKWYTSMTKEKKGEVLSLIKEAVSNISPLHDAGDLFTIAKFVSDAFDDRHGKYWQCLICPVDTCGWHIWPKTDCYLSMDVKLSLSEETLRVVLFKDSPSMWCYPTGWKKQIKVDIAEISKMSNRMRDEAQELVLQAIRRQESVHTFDDMNAMMTFMRDTWQKSHPGYWQIVVGEPSSHTWWVHYATESIVVFMVELTAIGEKMRILLFKARPG